MLPLAPNTQLLLALVELVGQVLELAAQAAILSFQPLLAQVVVAVHPEAIPILLERTEVLAVEAVAAALEHIRLALVLLGKATMEALEVTVRLITALVAAVALVQLAMLVQAAVVEMVGLELRVQ